MRVFRGGHTHVTAKGLAELDEPRFCGADATSLNVKGARGGLRMGGVEADQFIANSIELMGTFSDWSSSSKLVSIGPMNGETNQEPVRLACPPTTSSSSIGGGGAALSSASSMKA